MKFYPYWILIWYRIVSYYCAFFNGSGGMEVNVFHDMNKSIFLLVTFPQLSAKMVILPPSVSDIFPPCASYTCTAQILGDPTQTSKNQYCLVTFPFLTSSPRKPPTTPKNIPCFVHTNSFQLKKRPNFSAKNNQVFRFIAPKQLERRNDRKP